MKLRNKILTVLLSFLMVFSVFSVACNGNNGNGNNENVEPDTTPTVNATSDFTYHYATGTLHDIKVDKEHPIGDFIKNGQSKYYIVYKEEAREPAQFLSNMLAKCSGTRVNFYKREDVQEQVAENLNSANPSNYYIFVGCEDIFTSLGQELSSLATLGISGCQVKTVGKNVFINAYGESGYQVGVNDFLACTTGFDYIGYDTIYFSNQGETLFALDIVDRPDYDFRCPNDASAPKDQLRGQSLSATGNYFYSNGSRCNWVHNVKYFVGASSDQYYVNTSTYPDGIDPDGASEYYEAFLTGQDGFLFGDFIEEDAHIDRKWLSSDATMWQGCFTAHGDLDSYNALVKRFGNMLIYAMVTSLVNNIMYSANDVTTGSASTSRCTCKACEASFEYYGFTMGGAQASLMNDAVERLNLYKETYQDEDGNYPYKDREFNVVLLAYSASLPSPTAKVDGEYIYDENGNGVPLTQKWFDYDAETGSVTEYNWEEIFNPEEYDPSNPRKLEFVENAQVMYASSGANWTHTFYEPENLSRYTATKGWAGLGGKFYIWAYEKCYYMYLYPYPAHDSMAENYRYFYTDLHTKWLYSEGTGENPKCSGFSMLLEYMNGKLLYNVNYNYKDILDNFFEKFYDKAAPYMREMFDSIQLQLRWAEKEGYYVGTVHNYTMEKADVFSYGTIQTYLELIDKAYAAIEEYKYTNPELYASLYEHILIESLFPRFAMCTSYDVYMTDEDLLAARLSFKEDFNNLNTRPTSTPAEHHTISEWYEQWGIL